MDDYTPPEVRIDRLTDEQVAMLALLGNPPEIAPRSYVKLVVNTPEALRQLSPDVKEFVIRAHACPVAEILGRRRMIMPNGDVTSI